MLQRLIDSVQELLVATGISPEAWRRRHVFSRIYRENRWGHDENTVFHSGEGSRGEVVDAYVATVASRLKEHEQDVGRGLTIVDIGCGDFEVGRRLVDALPESRYVGCDIVPDLIDHHRKSYGSERVEFQALDAVTDDLPSGDVCLIRQVLQHLSNSDIRTIVSKLNYKYVYVTESFPLEREGPVNPDKPAGADVRFDWRTGRGGGVELDQPPFDRRVEEILKVRRGQELIVTMRVW